MQKNREETQEIKKDKIIRKIGEQNSYIFEKTMIKTLKYIRKRERIQPVSEIKHVI